MDTNHTPEQIEALSDSRPNRGLLEAVSRFGSPESSEAARRRLAAWDRQADSSNGPGAA